jgi:drug/metabolite transporter (DMT)-like permease
MSPQPAHTWWRLAGLRSAAMRLQVRHQTDSARRTLGLTACLLAAIGWGLGGVFAKLTSTSGLVLTFYRLWIGTAILVALALASGRFPKPAVLRSSWLGGVLLAADMALFFSAVKLTSVADVTVISAVQPILVLVAARVLFKDRVSRRDIGWILVAVAGVASVVIGPGLPGSDEVRGDLLAVGSLVAWSAYWIVTKRARDGVDALEYTVCVSAVAAVVISVVVLASGQPLGGVSSDSWLWICLLAVVPGTAHLLMNWAHRYVDATTSAVVGSSNPVFAATAAFIFLGEPLTAVQVVGGLIGLAAIAVVAARHRQPAESPVQ